MKNFKNLIAERLKADSATIPDTNAENFGDVAEKKSDDVPKVENAAKKSVEPSPSIQSSNILIGSRRHSTVLKSEWTAKNTR